MERLDPKQYLTLLKRISSRSFLCQTDLTLVEKKYLCTYILKLKMIKKIILLIATYSRAEQKFQNFNLQIWGTTYT